MAGAIVLLVCLGTIVVACVAMVVALLRIRWHRPRGPLYDHSFLMNFLDETSTPHSRADQSASETESCRRPAEGEDERG